MIDFATHVFAVIILFLCLAGLVFAAIHFND